MDKELLDMAMQAIREAHKLTEQYKTNLSVLVFSEGTMIVQGNMPDAFYVTFYQEN